MPLLTQPDEAEAAGFTALAERDRKRLELQKCIRSSWYLATEYLGYGWNPRLRLGLTERLHRPLFDWYDRLRHTDPYVGIWMRRKLGHKTTSVITWIIQEILEDPCSTRGYFHAVDEKAEEVLAEIAQHFQKNDKLRGLDPVGVDDEGKAYKIFPHKNAKKWAKAQSLTINRHRYSRTPTVVAKGAGSEITGGHFQGGRTWLDDIIARRTIINSQVQAIGEWYQNTVYPVTGGRVGSVGTPWSEQSIHQRWMVDPDWRTVVIPGAISEPDEVVQEKLRSGERKIHFTPSYKYENPMFWPEEWKAKARKQLKMDQKEMKGDFPPQIMVDPEPASEKPWSSSCENFTGIKKTEQTPGIGSGREGTIFVLSDPAPYLVGGYKGAGEKQRGDGTKDYWSLCVVKIRVRGSAQDIILLDGSHSLEWDYVDGANEAARLMKKYRTPYFISESPKEHHQYMSAACLRIGHSMVRDPQNGPLKFEDYNKADGKNTRFSALADRGKHQEFWICSETCPDEFLYDDGEHSGFLTQARKWRKIAQGKNSLRFDDDADVVARATDAALLKFAPTPDIQLAIEDMNDEDHENYGYRSRYCSA